MFMVEAMTTPVDTDQVLKTTLIHLRTSDYRPLILEARER